MILFIKLKLYLEEADESLYWLEVIERSRINIKL